MSFVDPYGTQLDPASEYVLWYINENAFPNILESDVYTWNLTTSAFAEGGSVEANVSNLVIEYTSVSMTLNSEGHIAMYYNLMPSYMATAYANDQAVINMLTTEGQKTYSSEAVDVEFTGAEADTKLTLFAVAVDANGKYGKVLQQEYTTKGFVYNDLSLAVELLEYKIDNSRISVACEGAEKYVYVYAQTSSAEWTDVYGGSKKKAGEYMIEFAGDSRICDTSNEKYALVDGCICLSNLRLFTSSLLQTSVQLLDVQTRTGRLVSLQSRFSSMITTHTSSQCSLGSLSQAHTHVLTLLLCGHLTS